MKGHQTYEMKERGQNKQGGEWGIPEETGSIQQAQQPEIEKKILEISNLREM